LLELAEKYTFLTNFMGGSPTPAMPQQLAQPSFEPTSALLNMQAGTGAKSLENQANLARMVTSMPLETWTPDIFGQQGALTQAGQIAAINAFRSREAEKVANPAAAAARENLYKAAEENTTNDFWTKQMEDWSKTKGLKGYLSSGLADSTIGKSGFFDAATAQGRAFRDANLQQAQNIIGQQEQVGLDPAQAIAAGQNAAAQGFQQRAANRAMGANLAQGLGQSTTDWINSLMSSTSKGIGAHQGNLQNVAQANWELEAQRAAAGNKAGGAMASGLGKIGSGALSGGMQGFMLGGPKGAAIGALAGGGMGAANAYA
jgi:hypothetical protein